MTYLTVIDKITDEINKNLSKNGPIKFKDENELEPTPLDLRKIIEIPPPSKPRTSWNIFVKERLDEMPITKSRFLK